jgi:hypothetical protein
MSSLANQQQNLSFPGLLQVPGGITSTLQQVQDGNGNPTGLSLSLTGASVTTSDTAIVSENGTPFANATSRLISDMFGDSLSVADFGAVGDGITNDTTAIQNALNAVGYGGTVNLGNGRYYVTGLTIPQYVTLQGTWNSPGYDGFAGAESFARMGSVLLLNPAGTISMRQSTSLKNLVVFNNVIANGPLPVNGSSSFSGIGITMGGISAQQCPDMTVENVMVLGFTTGIYGLRCINSKIRHVNIDCNNGISLDTGGNPIDIQWVLGWPFLSVGYSPYTTAQIVRSGTGIALQNNMDATRIQFCTFYDYTTGYSLTSCNGVTLIGCGADAPEVGSTAVGLNIAGACGITQVIGCQFVAVNTGILMQTSSSNDLVSVSACYFTANLTQDIDLYNGSAIVGSGTVSYSTCLNISVPFTTGKLIVSDFYASKTSGAFISAASNLNVYLGNNIVLGNDAVQKLIVATDSNQVLASANSVNLPPNRNFFEVSGTTNIFGFTNGWYGRTVTLKFASAVTLSSSAALLLNNNVNFTTQTDSTLTILATAYGSWIEVSRKI